MIHPSITLIKDSIFFFFNQWRIIISVLMHLSSFPFNRDFSRAYTSLEANQRSIEKAP